ncbi:MAG: hypothetical protein ACOX6T_07310 [Myxococcales bacterium]|jgi:hypothetical protein
MLRPLWLILAPLGALALLALLRRKGLRLPRPLNRMALTGMSLLVALGVSPLSLVACRSAAAEPKDKGEPAKGEEEPTTTDPWKRIERTLQEVEALGKRGPYPFDKKGKQRILAQIEARKSDVKALVAAGRVEAAEGALLEKELERAHAAMAKLRPTEMQLATCYRPRVIDPRVDALGQLRTRLPLLERIGEQGAVHPEVLRAALENIKRDLATLEETRGRRLSPEEKAEAEALGNRVRAALAKIEEKSGASAPKAE